MGLGVGMGKRRCYRKQERVQATRLEQKNKEQPVVLFIPVF